MFKRFFGKGSDEGKRPKGEGSFHRLGWVSAENNEFGVEMLDCRSYTRSVPANSENPKVAGRFLKLREAKAEDFRGRSPKDAVAIPCDLKFPMREADPGVVHQARVMEDKWDVFDLGESWAFVSSWSGDPVFVMKIEDRGDHVAATEVEADVSLAAGDRDLALRQADYLAKHYLYDWDGPLPLPGDVPNEPRPIAEYAFETYGRRASFATYEDPLPLRP